MNIAINGFGRIGRLVFQAALKKRVRIVAINDLTDTKTLAHLLKHDSVHGEFPGTVSYDAHHIIVNKKKIPVFAEKDPTKLPWKKLKVDVVVESTGRFRTKELAMQHVQAGAKKVLLSAPGKGGIKTVVLGVNGKDIKKKDVLLSNASCTTNSIAPLVKVLNDEFGVVSGLLTTIHSYTADQRLVDAPHSDLRRSRSAAVNIIPTSTGAAKAIGEVIPSLKGKLDGRAIRVPTPVGSITDMTFQLKKKVTVEDINKAIKKASKGKFKNIIEYSEDELVSSDIVGNTHSAIYDSKLTQVVNNEVKIFSWYDNETGYANRMADMLLLMK
jgi:glyceraldehyde 3-phosphate dehydrogenase